MLGKSRAHVRHHVRFYLAALLGVACFFVVPTSDDVRALAAGDMFFASYLLAMTVVTVMLSTENLKARAWDEDEGIALIFLVVLLAISFCCAAVFSVLSLKTGLGTVPAALAIAAVPLGWATLHTVAAYHYANLFYGPLRDPKESDEPAGLIFPGTESPGTWDFIYFSFVIGMTFQVSDVQIASSRLRRAALAHSMVSFFFNTAIIAMAVNAAVNLTS
ncbi:MAG: DUF1345 domain-containing protein [Alphaproteobacteria bacterium]|nr:DUF1345 domain-containing protein [Alphaproteobacteria bacterium]